MITRTSIPHSFNNRQLFTTRRSLWQRIGTLLTRALTVTAVGSLVALLLYGSYVYQEKGYASCKSNGGSTFVCATTLKWQSFKATFLK
jgi:hypothetical protein